MEFNVSSMVVQDISFDCKLHVPVDLEPSISPFTHREEMPFEFKQIG